jgi:glutathione S-transferase
MTGARRLLTLYGRQYCHLCSDMLQALEALRGELAFDVEVIDVDADPALVERYDELVPVLVGDGRELCHYHLDAAAVREYLADFR